ncbi:MAG: hypothetical protein AABY22_16455 [Nanoarchaeota archaeon]
MEKTNYEKLGIKVEIKNIASISDAKEVAEAEIMRQKIILFCGGEVKQVTRNYKDELTFPLRFYLFFMQEVLGIEELKKIQDQLTKL